MNTPTRLASLAAGLLMAGGLALGTTSAASASTVQPDRPGDRVNERCTVEINPLDRDRRLDLAIALERRGDRGRGDLRRDANVEIDFNRGRDVERDVRLDRRGEADIRNVRVPRDATRAEVTVRIARDDGRGRGHRDDITCSDTVRLNPLR